ncbi:MAG: L,D-transpeptidase family protein [Armatimonadetes bacterium]|nr:L,D-transpeptidase family protein [Armatimonadota bacterium]
MSALERFGGCEPWGQWLSLKVWALGLVLILWSPAAQAQLFRPLFGSDGSHVSLEGEDLYGIACHYNLSVEHLALANDILPIRIQISPGTRILIPGRRILPVAPPRNGIVLNIPERGLFLFRNQRMVRFYPIAIGRPNSSETPEGSFRVTSKAINPTWFPPEKVHYWKGAVRPGYENPLGKYWIGLGPSRGLGIHSTNRPIFIGSALTNGCIRLYPWMMEDLFRQVRIGMTVRIEYETAKIGCDPRTGTCYLAAFPDVYGRADPCISAQRLLKKIGLSRFATFEAWKDLTGRSPGLARPIILKRTGISAAELEEPVLDSEKGGR